MFAAPRISLHVWTQLHGGVSILLGNRGWIQRLCRPPGKPRCHALGSVACSACDAAGVQAADGLDVSMGVIGRQRLQLRFQCLDNRGATARGGRRIQLPYVPAEGLDTTGGCLPHAATCGTDVSTYTRDAPGMSACVL